jgi:ribonuclease D
VALTRASQQLFVTWCESRKGRTAGQSNLLANIASETNLKPEPRFVVQTKTKKPATPSLEDELRAWRSGRARVIKQPVVNICSDYELRLIAKQLPKTTQELASIVGAITAKKIGPDVLSIVAQAESRLALQSLK